MINLFDAFLLILFAAVCAWLWRGHGIRERALQLAKQHCAKLDVELLDGAVALRRLAIQRDARGHRRLARLYDFEFTVTGEHRYSGHLDLHGLQVGADTGVLRVLLRQRRQQRLQGHGDGLFVELTQQVARFALPLRQARQFFVQALFQLGDIGMEALAVGLRQLGELGLVQRLAVRHRGEGDVAAVAVQRHALLQRQALNHVQRLVVALVEATVDGALLLLVGRRLEHRREGGQQVVDQLIDIGDEIAGGAGRQLQGAWLAWLVEVVDVDAVGRGVHALGFRLEVALDEGEAPGTRLAHDEHVVARARHGHAELQGLDRARLAQHAAEGFEIIGTVEIELLGGEGAGQ